MSFDLTSPLPEKGVTVPIFTTFTGHKRVPLWAVATNSAYPTLRFFEDQIELRVIRKHYRPWRDVESVDAQILLRSNNLIFNFAGTPWNLTASLILPRYLRQSLHFLEAKGLFLTPRARQLMETPL